VQRPKNTSAPACRCLSAGGPVVPGFFSANTRNEQRTRAHVTGRGLVCRELPQHGGKVGGSAGTFPAASHVQELNSHVWLWRMRHHGAPPPRWVRREAPPTNSPGAWVQVCTIVPDYRCFISTTRCHVRRASGFQCAWNAMGALIRMADSAPPRQIP